MAAVLFLSFLYRFIVYFSFAYRLDMCIQLPPETPLRCLRRKFSLLLDVNSLNTKQLLTPPQTEEEVLSELLKVKAGIKSREDTQNIWNPGDSTQEIGIGNTMNLEHPKLTTGLLSLWYGDTEVCR